MNTIKPTTTPPACPDCGADWTAGPACQEAFYQMGGWELDHQIYAVHHLMVLCYHLQHPGLYSPEGLTFSIGLLVEFVDKGISPAAVRQRDSARLDSGARAWKIKGTPASRGSYPHPVRWTMTAGDVVAAGLDAYEDSVRAWSRLVLADLRASGNLPPG